MSGTKRPNNPPGNPYAAAAGAYGQQAQASTPNQRELESIVLLKAARKMQDLQSRWEQGIPHDELDEVLRYNRQIWLMFVDTAMEDKSADRTQELRNNIASLGAFIFKHTVDVLSDPKKEKLNILIEINREIAGGLMEKKG